MQPLSFFLRQPGLALLAGLCGLPGISQAADLDANLNATIVDATCKLTVGNGGDVYLPSIMRSWFYNTDGSDRYTPTDDAGGTPFTIHVDDCYLSGDINQLTFSFSPQSGFWNNQNQVFKNDATANAAENVGVVIFSSAYKTNVLNSDGSSAVTYDTTNKSSAQYLTDYQFYARYQNIGAVTGGVVTSNVLVDVKYE
ncbi:TPA: fimbrial protein [Salmonella enterica subsp. salamae serovar 35:g,m,s,t:-]|uniref:Fimbrial protein n=1 Tax=Salmonella enterica subsp. salamae TaxID=59202 RepID=A0A5Y3AVY6_SALER|nr:fimbrial protein [Salmonella enterica subsp. salamae]EKR2074988.1 fimbrial protein [Salmonella enterica subsp. salamae serovar 9,46:l,w:e,n,x]HCA3407066.1 fimbrial protein [Salmonella enterica subsp. salamae serovar 35:g,m,s,t:-]HCC0887296.1 fimbrial protein [Salmonella enterica]ECJ2279877.1 fimbrial protein [Salmonella enterica subsp. salamae]